MWYCLDCYNIRHQRMEPTHVVFLNRNAGAHKRQTPPKVIERFFAEAGIGAEFRYPDSAEDMVRQIADLAREGTSNVVVAGGDGTVRLAAQEMAHGRSALGILPMGTANNFATALGIPMDLKEAVGVIKAGHTERATLGKVGDRYFTEAAGVGFFAEGLAHYGRKSNKNPAKALAAAAKLLAFPPKHRIKITLDGDSIIERAAMCTAANAFRMARFMPIAPEADPADGALSVVIIGDVRRYEIPFYYLAIRMGKHGELSKVRFARARSIKIECLHNLNVHADDRVVTTTPVTITSDPQALTVFVPRR